jgi:hypothetical protein
MRLLGDLNVAKEAMHEACRPLLEDGEMNF